MCFLLKFKQPCNKLGHGHLKKREWSKYLKKIKHLYHNVQFTKATNIWYAVHCLIINITMDGKKDMGYVVYNVHPRSSLGHWAIWVSLSNTCNT